MSILENESLNTEYETLYDVGMFFLIFFDNIFLMFYSIPIIKQLWIITNA